MSPSESTTSTSNRSLRILRRGEPPRFRQLQPTRHSASVSTWWIRMDSRCRWSAQATLVEGKYQLDRKSFGLNRRTPAQHAYLLRFDRTANRLAANAGM